MTPKEIHYLLHNDPDFIAIRRYGYSLTKLMERYPDGVPLKFMADALQLEDEECEELYQDLIAKLREKMG